MDHFNTNKNSWNQRVETHFKSKFYDVPGFLSGRSSLNPIELEALGSVADKSLLHLQCHFGLDSLSWARMGATVTGVDISDVAITRARELNNQVGLKAEFICDDVYQFGANNTKQYDIVFTSYGAICWLPDINLWAQVVANSLKPGGAFYMVEFHPVIDLLCGYSYFHKTQPDLSTEGTYTENCDGTEHDFALWSHPISDVLNALLNAGLNLESMNEFNHSPYNCFDGMQERQPGQFCLAHKEQWVPVLYAIKATAPSPTNP